MSRTMDTAGASNNPWIRQSMTYQYDVMRPWSARYPHRPPEHKLDDFQGIPTIDKRDTDTETKPTAPKDFYDHLNNRLLLIGAFAVITKLLGFNEASWWLVLLPFYILWLLFIGIMLLSLPFLIFHKRLDKDKKDPTESDSESESTTDDSD